MNCRCMCVVFSVLTLLFPAHAQSSDWEVVKNLRPGTQIALQFGRHRFPTKCHLESVTEDDLTCALGWPVSLQERTYARASIGIVRIARNTAKIGLIAGATVGTAVGLARDSVPGIGRGGTALIEGGLLALLGAGIGGIAGPMFPGRVIYRAARQTSLPANPEKAAAHAVGTADTVMASAMESPSGSASSVRHKVRFFNLEMSEAGHNRRLETRDTKLETDSSAEPDPSMPLLFFPTNATFACESL